jgi:hypothetical protein
MGRLLSTLVVVGLLWAAPLGQDLDSVVIPAKTEIFVTLQRNLSTKTVGAGDRFYGEVAVPVSVDDTIVIPVGTSVIGHVEKARRGGRVKGESALTLTFDSIVLPDGRTRQIEAIVQSAENYPSTPITRSEGTVVAPGEPGQEVGKPAGEGAIKGATVGAIATRGLKGAGVGAAIGAAGGAILGIFKRGPEVEMRKGDSVSIVLTDSVRFVKPQPPVEGERLDR